MLRTAARRALPAVAIGWLAVLAVHGTAQANPACDSVTPALGDTVLCEYDAGGVASISIAIPPGTIRIDAAVRGGGGAAGGTSWIRRGYSGGSGAQVVASLSPSVATALTVAVGGGGDPKGLQMGGRGGGFSAIYDGSSASYGSVLAVAGGGGGGGYGTRCTFGGAGGEGGLGLPAGAGGSGSGGDTPGQGGSGGAGGAGGTVTLPFSGVFNNTPGVGGQSWSTGGDGGVGRDSNGDGGAGYGGGGSGGFVATASAVTCPNVGDNGTATDDGSGGGAGGSYAKPDRLIGTADFSNAGGAGGSWSGGALDPAAHGQVVLTFVAQTYTVIYDGNGATGGTAPTDHFGPYRASHIVTVCDNHRTDANCDFPNDERLTRVGYTFDGWNTAANGSGTSYAPATTFSINSDTVLYAQWRAVPPVTTPSASAATSGATSTPAATPALRTATPRTTAIGATVTFTAPGPGTATASGIAAQATRAGVTVCSGTTKVRRAGKAVVICKLNAVGRRLRAKGALTVALTTTFVAKTGARLQSTSTVTFARRG